MASPSRVAAQPASLSSCSRGADQPASSETIPVEVREAGLVVGSFNFGFATPLLTAGAYIKQIHCENFKRVCAKLVEEGDLDLLFGSEAGGHVKGLKSAGLSAQEMLASSFSKETFRVQQMNNYLAMWGFGGASQPASVSPQAPSTLLSYLFRRNLGPEMLAVITPFLVRPRGGASKPATVFLVVGHVHIVSGKKGPTTVARQRAVHHLRVQLETFVPPKPVMRVVRMIVGNDELTTEEAQACLQRQREEDPVWEVLGTVAGRNGDHIAVCGAHARFRPIAVGASFKDHGMHNNEQHDAVAVELTFRAAPKRAVFLRPTAKKRPAPPKESPQMDANEECGAPKPSVFLLATPKKRPAPTKVSPKMDADEASGGASQPATKTTAVDYTQEMNPLSRRAAALHESIREAWERRYIGDYDQRLLSQLSKVLFMKRKPQQALAGAAQPGDDEEDDEHVRHFASLEETGTAVLTVLQQRQDYLDSIGITDPAHTLSPDEREEMTKRVRDAYETSEEQLALQNRDHARAVANRKGDAGGVPVPPWRAKPAAKGSVANYVRQQKRKRWCLHLQRMCGSKQLWEVIAFTGCFDPVVLQQALQCTHRQEA